ncbi:MAG: hypothetical protein KDE08_13025 [Rhodobacteraceae bacterium]|nr:hypothetical protein [Paracoccaceae bacterium]
MNFDLSFYFAVFLRRLHYFIIIFALVAAASIAAAMLLPAVYQARAVLLVESSQITVGGNNNNQAQSLEKLQTIENRLMTRTNLLDIAQKHKVFKDLPKMSPDEVVQAMRDGTRINKNAGRGQATIMGLTFNGETGPIVAAVVNEYVTLILAEDVKVRTEGAEGTLDFFEQQVKSLSADIDQMKAKILDFQTKNSDALPNTLNFRLGQQTQTTNQIALIDQNISQLEDQKTQMIALFNATGQVGPVTTANMTPEQKQLEQLRSQLNSLLAVLSPTNPKIAVLKSQIAQLEAVVAGQSPANTGTAGTNPTQTLLDLQVADIDTRIAKERQQRETLTEQLKVLNDSIERTYANDVALASLNRDYANIQQQYDTAVARQAQAATTEKIEFLSKGERISVVDAATVPNAPISPNRLLIAGGGTFAGALLGIGVIVLLELLNRAVRRPTDLIRSFGITPIATIPYMRTPSEALLRRSGFVAMLLVAVIGIPAIIYAVHVYYLPLDIIVDRAAAKLGVRL